ncbi:MAG: two-component system sensor kinase FixL [Paraglaciecola sp.]|jgi:two-component system sensor kinase FixL
MNKNNLDESTLFLTTRHSSFFYAVLLGIVVLIAVALLFLSPDARQQAGNPLSYILLGLLLLSALTALLAYVIVTTRKQADQIRVDSQILEHLFKYPPGMAYRAFYRKDWSMEFVSDGCQTLSGYSKNEFESRKLLWRKLIHPDDYDDAYKSLQKAINTNGVFDIEYRILTKEKQARWVRDNGEAFSSNASNVIRLEGFMTDITAERLSKIELIESRAFSAAVVEAVVEAVITINDKDIIETFNRTAQEMFGYTFDEVIGRNIKVLMSETYSKDYDYYISRYLKDAKHINVGREVSAKHKDGSVFQIHVAFSEINNLAERKFVGLIIDLSQQHAIEKETRQHIEQLAHSDRLNLLGEMTAGIAHEINQPLTAISLFAQAGKRLYECGKPERLPDTFDKLSEHAQRAGAVIERMQMMAKQGDNVKETTECKVLTEEIIKLAEIEARTRDIMIIMDAPIALPRVFVDRVQIQQVVLNLLRNGMDAMTAINCQHGNVILLQILFNEEKNIEICVVDSGGGVSKQVEAKLFTPFSSTKAKGMGMGLSISKSIIAEHGGEIQFRNNASIGSTFCFSLPIEKRQIWRSQ